MIELEVPIPVGIKCHRADCLMNARVRCSRCRFIFCEEHVEDVSWRNVPVIRTLCDSCEEAEKCEIVDRQMSEAADILGEFLDVFRNDNRPQVVALRVRATKLLHGSLKL